MIRSALHFSTSKSCGGRHKCLVSGQSRATGLLLRCHTSKESAAKCAVQPQSGAYRHARFSDPEREKQRDEYSVGRHPVTARSQ